MTCCTARNQAFIAVNESQALQHLNNISYPIEIKKFKPKRTGQQNSTAHLWYQEMAEQNEQHDMIGWKAYCKLTYGVPIMLVDPEYAAFHDAAIKPLNYEQQLEAMRFIELTSLMDKDQAKLYMDMIYRNETQFNLTDPDSKMRKR